MRVVFCGSGLFAVRSLCRLLDSEHDLPLIVTQPSRPAGRGGKLRATPVAEAAHAAGRDVRECTDVNAPQAVAALRAAEADVICVADFGQMVRRAARDAARLGAFNLHGSILPALRGAAPVNWAIIRGHRRTGVTTFRLVDRMDAGPIYLQAETDVRPGETAEELRERLAELGADLVCQTVGALEAGGLVGRPQDESKVTLAPRLDKPDGVIDWGEGAEAIVNRIHGTWPWPGGQAVFQREDASEAAVLIARAAAEPPAGGAPRSPGEIDADLRVTAGGGRVRIVEIKPAGRRLMAWRDFVNGYRVRPGSRFRRKEA